MMPKQNYIAQVIPKHIFLKDKFCALDQILFVLKDITDNYLVLDHVNDLVPNNAAQYRYYYERQR